MPESNGVSDLLSLGLDITSDVHSVSTAPVFRGGFADIFEGTLNHDGVPLKVALKVVYVSNPQDMRTSRRLLREISIWKSASHPNVHSLCGLYERPNSLPAMVSPWCRNGDINRYLKAHQENPHLDELKLRLLSQAVQGLNYRALIPLITRKFRLDIFTVHENHIVHADLKGGNVLISDDGVARLADFGLSALRTSDAFTSTSTVAGTYRWMAPELINEKNSRHTYASDIWAAGCLIIEVQSGSHPYYSAENDHYVLLAIGNRQPPPRPSNMPDFLWALVQSCCNIDPAKRISIIILLMNLLVGSAVQAHHPRNDRTGAPTRDTQTMERIVEGESARIVHIQDAARHLSVLLPSIPIRNSVPTWRGLSAMRMHRLFSPSSLRPLAKKIASTDPASASKLMRIFSNPIVSTFALQTLSEQLLAWLPNQRLLAYGDRILDIIDIPTQRVSGHKTAMTNLSRLALSPDRRLVAIPAGSASGQRNTVHLRDVQTGHTLHEVSTGHTDAVTCLAFSFDALRIASGAADSSVRIYDIETARLLILSGHSNSVSSVAFAPDGSQIAFTSLDGLRLWDAHTGQCLMGPFHPTLAPDLIAVREVRSTRATFSPDGRYVVWEVSYVVNAESSITDWVHKKSPTACLGILDTETRHDQSSPLFCDMPDAVGGLAHLSYSPLTARADPYLLSLGSASVDIRERATGVKIAVIQGGLPIVHFEALAFCEGGDYFATTSASASSKTLTIWDPTWFRWDM